MSVSIKKFDCRAGHECDAVAQGVIIKIKVNIVNGRSVFANAYPAENSRIAVQIIMRSAIFPEVRPRSS